MDRNGKLLWHGKRHDAILSLALAKVTTDKLHLVYSFSSHDIQLAGNLEYTIDGQEVNIGVIVDLSIEMLDSIYLNRCMELAHGSQLH